MGKSSVISIRMQLILYTRQCSIYIIYVGVMKHFLNQYKIKFLSLQMHKDTETLSPVSDLLLPPSQVLPLGAERLRRQRAMEML